MEHRKKKILKTFNDPEDARFCLKSMVRDDCHGIGIYDEQIIGQIIKKKQHNYRIINTKEFDEVGNIINNGVFEIVKMF